MFAIIALVCYAGSAILWVAKTAQGQILTWQFFLLFGMCWLALHLAAGPGPYNWPWRRQ